MAGTHMIADEMSEINVCILKEKWRDSVSCHLKVKGDPYSSL